MEELDYLQLVKESRKIKRNMDNLPEVKVAVLGDSTTQFLADVLKAYLYRQRVFVNIYVAEYDIIDQEVYDTNSNLYEFNPDFVLLHISVQKLRERFAQGRDINSANFIENHVKAIQGWWERINSQLKCRIIQNLYAIPQERPYGNYTLKVCDTFYTVTEAMNRVLVRTAREYPNVFINDIEYIAASIGKKQWFDEKLWVFSKHFCSFDALPQVAESISKIILAGLGKSKKCVVLDLDNTLWGGIIGEDGLERIEVGHEGVGEAYLLFQQYLLELKERGIILAVCSKNDYDNAILPFQKHPDMVLREEDIAIFVANWNNKVDNIKHIAQTLNIGLDSMIFVDDSPFERNLVRLELPQVTVPEMPEDAAEYAAYLNQLNLFETLTHSEEDKKRSEYYRQQTAREAGKEKHTDINDYLQSLNMKAQFAQFDSFHLPRIVQLIQRSNQFNLTTKRYNEQECEGFMNNDSYYPFYVTLSDKFGDSGLIAVIILKADEKKLVIDSWLMSCRVLCRGIEQFCMNKVMELAQSLELDIVEGFFRPTAKNKMVAKFYKQFGFDVEEINDAKESTWRIMAKDYSLAKTWVEFIDTEKALNKEEQWQAKK